MKLTFSFYSTKIIKNNLNLIITVHNSREKTMQLFIDLLF